MKRSTAAVATTLLLGLGANSAQAFDPQLRGSDTLGPIMDYVIGTAANPTSGYGFFAEGSMIEYSYEGSGTAQTELQLNNQELGPRSAFLSTSGGAGCAHPTAVSSFAGCWRVAQDALSIFGSPATASTGAAPEQACVLSYNTNMAVADANGNGSVVCPGCVGGSYPFADWRSALRIIYAGEEVNAATAQTALSATRDCNSDVRRTLVNSWGNLFNGTCGDGSCASGLKHAFRRDDVSGTTAVFLQLLNLPPISTNPFCNGNETEDRDPVRRPCAGNGAQGIPGASGGETVCGFGPTPTTRNPDNTLGTGNLGLVLPVLIPPVPVGAPANFSKYGGDTTLATRNCSSVAFGTSGGGAFGRVLWTLADVLKFGARCPDGSNPLGGTCLWPKAPGSPPGDQGTANAGFGCIANQNSRPTGSPATFDARIYNVWARNSDGTIKQYIRPSGSSTVQRPTNAAFYRYRQHNCREEDETGTQACIAVSDTCTIGFGGRSGITEFGAIGLGLRERVNAADAFPTQQDAVVDDVYPLARPLYLCELDPTPADAFPGDQRHQQVSGPCPAQDLDGNGVLGDVCYTTDDFVAAQLEVRADLRNNVHTVLDPAAEAGDFFPVPTFQKTCCAGTYNSATDTCQ